jgi:peptide/nickel transport system substrate-binding protein
VPTSGGKYIEGLIGSPKYINPLYAQASDVDSDLAYLVYSSLFDRAMYGKLKNDLAKNYSISDDGKIYTIEIRDDAKWHTGGGLNADDVIFTFYAIKDGQYNSTLRNVFIGVSMEKINDYSFKFILSEPYAPFLELLTFGILPKDLWSEIIPESASLAELNLKPIGSGPYKFKSIVKDKSGRVKEINLTVNDDYYSPTPYINDLSFVFYSNIEEAISGLNNNSIQGISYLPASMIGNLVAKDSLSLHKLAQPQINGIFFNQKIGVLKDKKLRQALAYAINKNKIISDLDGSASQANGPIPSDNFAYKSNIKNYNFNPADAEKLLDEIGWKIIELKEEDLKIARENINSEDQNKKLEAENMAVLGAGKWRKKDNNFLILHLATVDNRENYLVAENIKSFWENVGIKTIIETVLPSEIQANVIIPRKFEILLYGQILGGDPDSYVFWHSSQSDENGLNLSNYQNKDLDKILEEARLTFDIETRKQKYYQFQDILLEDLPAIFLYSPFYNYAQTKKIHGFQANSILMPRDRFSGIANWYIKTAQKIIW